MNKYIRRFFWLSLSFVCLAFGIYVFCKYNKPVDTSKSSTDFLMNTVVTQTIYGNDAAGAIGDIVECIDNLENDKLSWRRRSSEVYSINRINKKNTQIHISKDMYEYLSKSIYLAMDSEGAYDPTILPITKLWNIEGDNPIVPEAEKVEKKLKKVNYEDLIINPDYSITKLSKVKLDLGAVGKGIACDEALKILQDKNIDGAVIAVGGSILTYGSKPDNSSWQVAIRDPNGDISSVLGIVSLIGTHFVSTSGVYEKFFIVDGVRYHHILDPHTGYPSDNEIVSVSIICNDGLYSDGLSTACLILGYEDSIALLEKYEAEAIFVTENNDIYLTPGLVDIFSVKAEGYSIKEWGDDIDRKDN